MKVAFLTEMNFDGKITVNHKNMRTEFTWMVRYGANHFNIRNLKDVIGYDRFILQLD